MTVSNAYNYNNSQWFRPKTLTSTAATTGSDNSANQAATSQKSMNLLVDSYLKNSSQAPRLLCASQDTVEISDRYYYDLENCKKERINLGGNSYGDLVNGNTANTEEITEENYVIMALDTTGKPTHYYAKATEQQLEWGGQYTFHADGTISFYCPKEDWLNKGTQGLKEGISGTHATSINSEIALNALEKLPAEKRAIADLIDTAASRAGLSDDEVKKLKIETTNGKIVVGGLKDKNKLKKMEQALNEIEDLPKRIEEFQLEERILYDAIKSLNVTPYQLTEGGRDFVSGMEYLEWRVKENGGDIDSLTNLGNSALAYAAVEYFRDPIETADFSHKKKGVANPAGDMESALFDLKNKIADAVMSHNRLLDENDPTNIDMQNITIRMTSSGKIEFGGNFSTEATTNYHAETMLRQIVEDVMAPGEDGSESLFATALQRMIAMHDDAFGGENIEKEAVFEFGMKSSGNAYVEDKTGEAESITMENIGKSIAEYVRSVSPDEKVDKSEFSVSEDGKIQYTGFTSAAASEVVQQLNAVIDKVNKFGTHVLDMELPINKLAVDIIKNLNSLDSYGPNASKKYLNYSSPSEQDDKFAEQYNKWYPKQNFIYAKFDSTENDESYARRQEFRAWQEQEFQARNRGNSPVV